MTAFNKLATMGINFDVSHCPGWKNVLDGVFHAPTSFGEAAVAGDRRSPYGTTAKTKAFLDELTWRARVVFEYSRKQITMGERGDVNVAENVVSRQNDGLTLATAVPRPIQVAGPHSEAYKI